ncbi:histidine--tRNA ligase [Chitinispirillales bacterium ANBcel5]|uniref:histidine--tRNA ligase n=1 Tax=Cellulosispirillum alkaliphilum TaxID=3039283 RepID=UPI002A534203|nr:histidine--tRNA ligase [Chitinispirillales bacterium ANBcel5]
MAVPTGPRGTRDFYPEDMAFQQFIFDSWRKSSEKYGFEQCEGPMFEHLEVYSKKSGNEIEKQLYSFEDKGGRSLSLRPELTPTVARMVASRGTNLKRPVRWYSIPRLFRYEKMQRGRLREFFQLNMDLLGIEDVSADAELIAASISMMRDFGFSSQDFKARISSRTLLEELFESIGIPKTRHGALYALLDKKHKIPSDIYDVELEKTVGDCCIRDKVKNIFSLVSLDEVEEKFGLLPSVKNLKHLFSLLNSYGMKDYTVFDIGIVRGLAYYTGVVFELFDVDKSMRAIAGGGRYDTLIKLYGGPPTPAVGFAAGDVVLGDFLKEKGIQPPLPPRSDIFLVSINISYDEIIKTAQILRQNSISCEFSLRENIAVGKQLKAANAARAKYVLFVGGEEYNEGKLRLKDMETGSEELFVSSDLISIILKKL